MAIEKNQVVQFHYTLTDLTDDKNEFVESTEESGPQAVMIGHNQLLAKLEEEMVKHNAGDKFELAVEAKDAYGERNEGETRRVPIKHLLTRKKKYLPGDIVSVNTSNGGVLATIVKAGKFNVDLDTNHPLAGRNLKFEVEVVEVRDATEEELAHGHAHGPGGHQH